MYVCVSTQTGGVCVCVYVIRNLAERKQNYSLYIQREFSLKPMALQQSTSREVINIHLKYHLQLVCEELGNHTATKSQSVCVCVCFGLAVCGCAAAFAY